MVKLIARYLPRPPPAAAALVLLLLLLVCASADGMGVSRRELRTLRQQAEADQAEKAQLREQLRTAERRRLRWQRAASWTAAGAVALLVVGTILGSGARNDAERQPQRPTGEDEPDRTGSSAGRA